MDLATIERLMEMLQNSSLNELDVSENGMRIRLSKTASRANGSTGVSAQSRRDTPEAMAAAEIAALMALPDVATTDEVVVVAGLSGTFYRAPSPGAEPYVREGERVEEGRTIALVEAMKMLNPVEAPRAGRITRILAEDGEAVTPGTALALLAAD